MTRICHLLDASFNWEHRVAASQLLDRLPREHFTGLTATVDAKVRQASSLCHCSSSAAPSPFQGEGWGEGMSHRGTLGPLIPSTPSPFQGEGRGEGVVKNCEPLPRWLGLTTLAAPSLARFVARHKIDVIHCWGIDAARVARMATGLPLVITLSDPGDVRQHARLLRSISRDRGFAIVCSSETVRRRLYEGGVDPSACVLIRPGVDFFVINEARKSGLRQSLGIRPDHRVLIVPEPVTTHGEQFEAVWAVVLRNHLSGGLRVILPGRSREGDRITRLVAANPAENPLVLPGDDVPFERLVAIADTLLITPRGDLSTTAVAWAMAAGCAIIGTAVYCVAELISHKVNGLLFKQTPGRSMAASIVKLLDDRDAQSKVREAARGQAYEVFGLRRFVDQHARLYDNLLSARTPSDGIADPAAIS